MSQPTTSTLAAQPSVETAPPHCPASHLVTHLEVIRWETADPAQFDFRSSYVERYWLALLGPSTLWLMRRLSRGLEEFPSGFRINLQETSRALGLGSSTSKSSSLQRTIERALQFSLLYRVTDVRVAAKTQVPLLNPKQLSRLPESLQHAHDDWVHAHLDDPYRFG